MKKFLFILLGLISLASSVSALDTVFGMACKVYSEGSFTCAVENRTNKAELWGGNSGDIVCFNRQTGQLKTYDLGDVGFIWSCDFDNSGNIWVGGTKCIVRLKISDGTFVKFDASQASALNGIVRCIKFDKIGNRIICVSDAGTCFVRIGSSGDVIGWDDYPEIGKSKNIGKANVLLYSNEVWVVSSFVYRWLNGQWVTYDTTSWNSGLALGSAIDVDGNIYIGDESVIKWSRATESWGVLIADEQTMPIFMGIDKNGIMIWEGPELYCKVNLRDKLLAVESYERDPGKLTWDACLPNMFSPLLLTEDSNFLIVGRTGIVDFSSSASPVIVPVSLPIDRELYSVFGCFDPLGRRIVNFSTNSSGAKVSAGTYFVWQKTNGGKTYVNKTTMVR